MSHRFFARLVRLTGTVRAARGPSRLTLGCSPGPTALLRRRSSAEGARGVSTSTAAAPCKSHEKRTSSASGNEGDHGHPRRPTRSLLGKVAVVTGAGGRPDVRGLGNGTAIALLLAEDGAAVVCADRELARAQAAATMARRERDGTGLAVGLEADVTSPADCERVVAETVARFGRLDILVNTVGAIGAKGDATQTDLAEWARGMELNVSSMMLMAKYAVPAMRKNEGGSVDVDGEEDGGGRGIVRGAIVNIGSVAGLQGGTPSLLYPTSKGAVVNMTRAMAAHHGSVGIRVNCVCPGMLYTPMMSHPDGHGAKAAAMNPAVRAARRNRSLLRTEGNAWDCAAAVRFLVSDEARWITGAILTVDAGATAAVAVASQG